MTEFGYSDIEEMIETKALLTYMNFMINEMIYEYAEFKNINFCRAEGVDCLAPSTEMHPN